MEPVREWWRGLVAVLVMMFGVGCVTMTGCGGGKPGQIKVLIQKANADADRREVAVKDDLQAAEDVTKQMKAFSEVLARPNATRDEIDAANGTLIDLRAKQKKLIARANAQSAKAAEIRRDALRLELELLELTTDEIATQRCEALDQAAKLLLDLRKELEELLGKLDKASAEEINALIKKAEAKLSKVK